MKGLKFRKVQTLGNDFVLVHAEDVGGLDLSALAIELCPRRTSVGADGLLAVGPHPEGLTLRMFNPDGSEDFCGNGLRCAGLHGRRQGWVSDHFAIQHGQSAIPTRVHGDGTVSILLPPASFEPAGVPVNSPGEVLDQLVGGVRGTAVSTGSTHFVVLVDKLPDDPEFLTLGPRIEHDPLFPERTSVIFAKPVSQTQLDLRIWERGVGETLGCGTGSVAAAVVWARRERVTGRFLVRNPGGDLAVSLDDLNGPILSESKPVESFTGLIHLQAPVMANRASLA